MWGEVVFNSDTCAKVLNLKSQGLNFSSHVSNVGRGLELLSTQVKVLVPGHQGKRFWFSTGRTAWRMKGRAMRAHTGGTEMETELLLGFENLGGDVEEDLHKHLVLSVRYLWHGRSGSTSQQSLEIFSGIFIWPFCQSELCTVLI